MQWCNCNHNDYYRLGSSVDELGNDGHPTCYRCGCGINNEDIILLLVKEVKRLSISIEMLEFEKMDRERVRNEDEVEEDEAMKRIEAEDNRFNILDL